MSGAVPCFGDVMADIFDSNFEKVTLNIWEKFTDIIKVNEDWVKVATEEKNVINNDEAAVHKIGFIKVNLICFRD